MARRAGRLSVKASVIGAAALVAATTLVAGMVSWVVYARIEALLVAVSEEQSATLSAALRLAETSNRFAAASGEIEAARSQLQRQNASVALAQHAQALYEVIAALRRTPVAAPDMDGIERLAQALETALGEQNALVETRIGLEAQARRQRVELGRIQGAIDALIDRLALTVPPPMAEAERRALQAAAGAALIRLYEAGQIDQPTALAAVRSAFLAQHARIGEAAERLPTGSAERGGVEELAATLGRLGLGDGGVFALRETYLGAGRQVDRIASDARQLVTRLGVAVARLVARVEEGVHGTKDLAALEIDAGRRWLVVVAAVTFLGPVLLVWLAVGRFLVRPLERLAAATRTIAAGDLATPIPQPRHAELQEIADALAVFRESMAALGERTRALQASEESERLARREAETALADLRNAQEQLVQAEKMAALASLVSGVAHEINTPIGVTVTSSSLLVDEVAAMVRRVEEGVLKRSEFTTFLERVGEIAGLIGSNMERAANLVQAFKQVSADQSSGQRRLYRLKDTLEQTLTSVRPATQKAGVATRLSCPDDIVVDGDPGAVSQIVTILIMNAIDHAFEPGRPGTVAIAAMDDGPDGVRLDVDDDGRGIAEDIRRRVFEPFFTTRRSRGNTGLGLHIAFNVARRNLHGHIDLAAAGDLGGARFVIRFPIVAPADMAPTGAGA